MAFDIIVGRSESDRKKFGNNGVIFLGKQYVKMGQVTSLSNSVFMDVVRSHVVYVTGKRGSGKSYTLGVISEGISSLPKEVADNISVIIFDTMGIFWTMKYPNLKDEDLLKEWGLKSEGIKLKIYTPIDFFKKYQEEGIPTDEKLAIKPSELTAEDWVLSFGLTLHDPIGVVIERVLNEFEEKNIKTYSIDDIVKVIKNDKDLDETTKNAAINRFIAAKHWGVFSEKATTIKELAQPGQVSVLDVSCYSSGSSGWGIKSLVIGLICKKLFSERMIERKKEELAVVGKGYSYLPEDEVKGEKQMPLVWIIVDEAHELLPQKGKTAATDALITLLREGRQPGISLILATQQPGKIHDDVSTQADVVISHRITAKPDIDALNSMMQSYMLSGLTGYLNNLPRESGAAVILDDNSERIYPICVRPRFTWHGGESPTAIKIKKKLDLGLE